MNDNVKLHPSRALSVTGPSSLVLVSVQPAKKGGGRRQCESRITPTRGAWTSRANGSGTGSGTGRRRDPCDEEGGRGVRTPSPMMRNGSDEGAPESERTQNELKRVETSLREIILQKVPW